MNLHRRKSQSWWGGEIYADPRKGPRKISEGNVTTKHLSKKDPFHSGKKRDVGRKKGLPGKKTFARVPSPCTHVEISKRGGGKVVEGKGDFDFLGEPRGRGWLIVG